MVVQVTQIQLVLSVTHKSSGAAANGEPVFPLSTDKEPGQEKCFRSENTQSLSLG